MKKIVIAGVTVAAAALGCAALRAIACSGTQEGSGALEVKGPYCGGVVVCKEPSAADGADGSGDGRLDGLDCQGCRPAWLG